MEKNANENQQVSGPGLYKRILLVPKVAKYQQVCYLTTCLLLVVTCYTWEGGQMPPSQAKRKGLLLMKSSS